MGLVWAENVVRKTNGSVLYLTALAVSHQILREAEKFGIEARRSVDGTAQPGITVANYERLHLFKPEDFSGMVCDECFPAGTPVDTPYGKKHIEDLRPGDYIVNCSGIDTVQDVHRREIQYATLVKIGNTSFIASPNHPVFTQRGWVGAQHLRPGDYALGTGASMSLVRSSVRAEVPGTIRTEILRDILLSEMAHDSASSACTGTFGGSGSEARAQAFGMVERRISRRPEGTCAHHCVESDEITGGASQDIHPLESHEAQTFRAWGQWPRDDLRASGDDGCTWRRLDSGICFITGPTQSRLSNLLQNRLRQSADESRHRGGWELTSSRDTQGRGCEEGGNAAFARVDGIEILERGDPRLEQFRHADGKLYFYDLGATRHPSYSVCGFLVHNSSILKNFDGSRRNEITVFLRKVPYRLLATATAAPNDYLELGTSSEALGNLGHMDMLNRFFKNDLNNSATGRSHGEVIKWRLKGHAEMPFWRWVCSWARACRRPSDLGFDDGDFILPPLEEFEHLVEANTLADGMLFALPAVGLKEQREERRRTVRERCEKVAALVDHAEPALIWCHLNEEGDLLEKLIPDAVQVSGTDSDDEKEEKLLAFATGDARKLITKPRIAGFGLNYQHCAHVTFFPSHSYEQYYQGVRRCWRFGQKRAVRVDVVTTEGEQQVLKNLRRKSAQADKMFSNLIAQMRNGMRVDSSRTFSQEARIPTWL